MNIDSMAETNFHQPASLQCLSPPTYSMDGLHTTNTTLCAGPSSLFCSATPNIDSKYTSPTFSHSGSSARTSSVCTDDDIAERNQEFSSPFPSTSATTLEVYSAIFQAPPIYAPEPTIGYGADRLTFIERLIWDSVRQIASIYGGLLNEPKTPTGKSLETLVHEGLIHGLCNEIVILPIMAAIQTRQGDTSQHHADMIPFPLFVAEMLRRMRASYFLFCTAMRYMLDIEPEVRAARERAKCGWCLSGARGCEHSRYQDLGVASRFSRGRSAILRKQKLGPDDPIPASHFTRSDPLAPLADPRKAFLGALILANKFHRDRTIGNKSWAALIGLSLEEVHAAERAVGQALGWALSRPWVGEEKDDNGNWKLGSSHPSFAETLFATNDHEVAKYGIKELREKGTLPPPVKSLQATLSHPLVRTGSNTIVDRQGHLSSSKLIRRSRSQTPLADERRIAPLPHRQQSLNQTLSLTNPIKKASSAPIVLQPFASGYTEEPAQDDMVDAIVRSEWAVCSSASPSSSEWMDATPTIEQIRSKRKASEDFGPTPLIRRGEQGQRMPVVSPTMHVSHTSSPAPAEPRGFDHSFVPWDGVVHDDSMSPGLTMGTPTTSSPSVGLLTRMGTPADLSNMSDVDHERPLTSRSSFAAFHPPRHFKSSLGMPTLTRANTLPV